MEIKTAIFKTLIYSDIFDYPLTKDGIWKFLISEKLIKRKEFEKELNSLVEFETTPLGCNRSFYYLLGREEIVQTRIKRLEESRIKINRAKKIISLLSFIPTVLLIGISGGLALNNADEKDDIDLFVITSKGSLWITRLFLVCLLILMGQYRGRGKKKSQKICLNMLIDESSLELQKNLYTAHEIVQLLPIFQRDSSYKKFVGANKWIAKFLPNAIDGIKNQELRIKGGQYPLFILNYLAKAIQLWYMKKHKTKEIISDHMLAFHPFDYKGFVLKEYNKYGNL